MPPRPPKQLRDGAEQVSSREETVCQTSQCDGPEEVLYKEIPIKEDEVNIKFCEVKRWKVCQSIINEIKLH